MGEERKKFWGFDTEVPLGWLKVIATDEEAMEVDTFQDILTFLNQNKFRGAIFFLFNLQYDSEAMLKLTKDMEFLKNLYFEGAKPKGIDYNDNVKIRYIPSKFLRFCFKHGSHSNCVSFYDISQFYGGWTLDKVGEKFLNMRKNPISGERIGSEKGYYEKNKEDILKYCQQDAKMTLEAAMLMKKTMESVKMPKGNLSFRNPISCAKVSEMYIKDNFKYPKVPEALDFFHWISEQAYHGGIFSTERRGLFDQTLYSYDINSAYPKQMFSLPHWANGSFEHVEKPNEIDTRYGWFLCRFNCPYISYPDYSHPYKVEFCYNDVYAHISSLSLHP